MVDRHRTVAIVFPEKMHQKSTDQGLIIADMWLSQLLQMVQLIDVLLQFHMQLGWLIPFQYIQIPMEVLNKDLQIKIQSVSLKIISILDQAPSFKNLIFRDLYIKKLLPSGILEETIQTSPGSNPKFICSPRSKINKRIMKLP